MPIAFAEPRWELLDFPVSLQKVWTHCDGEDHLLPGARSVFREDSKESLDLVSARYRLLPHTLAFQPIHDLMPELPYPLDHVTTAVGHGGGLAQVEWIFKHKVEVQDGDWVALSLLARNSLDRSAQLHLELAARRLLCSNGMRGPGPSFCRAWRHRQGALNHQEALRWVLGLFEEIPSAVDQWRSWTRIRLFPQRVEEFLREDSRAGQLLGQRARTNLMQRLNSHAVDHKVTLWYVYSVLTEYATHRVKTRSAANQLSRKEDLHKLALRFVLEASKN